MTKPQAILPYMYQFKLNGHTIDDSWYKIIRWQQTEKKPEGKPCLSAIVLLSDIFFWYTPTITNNEDGTFSLTKKFKADILQRSYKQIEEKFGLTKDEARRALAVLEDLGIIKLEFRDIFINGKIQPNTMYINFNPKKLKKLMTKFLKKSLGSSVQTDEGSAFKPTYTYNSLHKGKKKESDSPNEKPLSEEDFKFYKVIEKVETLFWLSAGDKWDFVAEYGKSIVDEVLRSFFTKYPSLQKNKVPDILMHKSPRSAVKAELEKEKNRRLNGKPENAK